MPGAEPGVHDGARHVDGKDDGGDDERDGELLVLGHFLVLLARPLLDLLLGGKGKGGMSEGAMGRGEDVRDASMAYLTHGVAEDGHGKRGEHGEDGENDGNGDEGGCRAGLGRVGRVGGAHALGRREEEDNGKDERGNGSTGERENSRATVRAMWTRWRRRRGKPSQRTPGCRRGRRRLWRLH